MAEKILMPITELDPDLIEDIREATEDVPLIEGDHLTEAGEIYILSLADFERVEVEEEYLPTLAMRAVEDVRHYQNMRG